MKNQGMDDYRTMQTNPFGRVPAKKDEIRLKEAGGVELQGRRTVGQRLLAAVYPERCACCGRVVPCGELICGACRARLPAVEPPLCPFCGCGRADCACEGRRRITERAAAPFYYEGAARDAVRNLKFHNRPYASEPLALAMAATVRRELICGEDGRSAVRLDGIVPVPVSPATRKRRGYNQSALLAKGLADTLELPMEETLVKLWDVPAQRNLPAYRRSGNVLGVFDRAAGAAFTGRTLLLVDDIATTGATLDECAKMLKIYGAREVYAVTAAVARRTRTAAGG